MPAHSKIQDETEVLRWFDEGWTYPQMVDEYLRKYNIETTPTMWSNWRRRRGLDNRIVRDDELIPWNTSLHPGHYALYMLRLEARRRAGVPLSEENEQKLNSWLAKLNEANAVVHYDPDTAEGFHYVPRERKDEDIIRRPARKTTLRPAAH